MDHEDPECSAGAGGSHCPQNDNISVPSSVRVGLKRELAFALKSQAEVSETLGQSRLRKPPSSPFPAETTPASAPAVKKRGRKKRSEFCLPDVRILKTNVMPAPEKSTVTVPFLARQAAAVRPGFSAEIPIVVDDLDNGGRATNNVAVERGWESSSTHVPGSDLTVPGWLEQQVSRITQAGNKYVMQGMEAGVFYSSDGGSANFDPGNANASARLSSPESVLDSIESTSREASRGKTSGKITRKDVRLHKLVFMEDVLPEGTMLRYIVNGIPQLVGYAKDSGIYCTCCNEVVSPSQFEAHAGHSQRRKPYNYIYTSNGVSLHELSVTLSKRRKLLDSENDDLCSICEDAGELVLCDLCPRAFHQACAGLSSVPEGDWHCRYCETMHQRENYVAYNDNARAAGRIPGVDAIDQILKRCILIVKLPDCRVGGCALCRSKDYTKTGFGPRTVLICDQCEKEYHVGCLKNHGRDELKEKPEGDWFCCADCVGIHSALQGVLSNGAQALPDLVLDNIKRNDGKESSIRDAGVNLKWRLFRGKTASASDKFFLSRAVSLLHESFDPIIGGKKGSDLVTQMIFGRCWDQMDFQGMYCAVLIMDSSVVSVSTLRILGSEVAELPLVATKKEFQGQGYFVALFACIKNLLVSLNVKHLVLPATDEAQPMWTQRFGFRKISMDQLYELAQGIKIVDFEGTTLLHTAVSDLTTLAAIGTQGS
ncbi:increased DNA methylation 1-like [Phalaenopsis equestris]|uniref:increased DNA methylation 1-like n=1 Tax=Phalaenopsis equestris TaxID=78828 RepID=UPI0009E51860|nr:increased DNA methylation 1-like [Phalaenopsis equestris]